MKEKEFQMAEIKYLSNKVMPNETLNKELSFAKGRRTAELLFKSKTGLNYKTQGHLTDIDLHVYNYKLAAVTYFVGTEKQFLEIKKENQNENTKDS